MATNQSQNQSQDIASLEAFRQDRNRDIVREIVSNREAELTAAKMFLEVAIRAFGVEPEKLEEITKEPEVVAEAPVAEIIELDEYRANRAQQETFEQVVADEAAKSQTVTAKNPELNVKDIQADVTRALDAV